MNKKVILISLAILVVLIVGWWLASPLFLDKVVEEGLPEGEIKELISQGDFIDADSFHKTSGTVKVVNIDGKRYLTLENFETTNGPDLFVYLATDVGSEDFVNLGELKGNIGSQNYEVSDEIDLQKYNKVLIWCRAFSVLFGSAELN